MVVPYYDANLGEDASWLPLPDLLLDAGEKRKACCVLVDVRWPTGAELLLKEARKYDIPSVFDGDVANAAVLRRLAPLASHAIFSETGFMLFANRDVVSDEALSQEAAAHGGVLGVTLGARGFVWASGKESSPPVVHRIDAPVVHAVDTLAAGDVFHGAFAVALAEQKSIEDAARFSCTAAALKCTKFGGRLGAPTRSQVDQYLQQVQP
eukprot:TRINITY_DN27892_c0_g1_i1.p1 TRINITY_DN27892_c0_g1~~TRINITY_DN27892_c0_g1_i1.p1  ORF type:complete len:234 (-),score=26.50 TRINITY_DN27892_c0_g1_i1:192-818(-)